MWSTVLSSCTIRLPSKPNFFRSLGFCRLFMPASLLKFMHTPMDTSNWPCAGLCARICLMWWYSWMYSPGYVITDRFISPWRQNHTFMPAFTVATSASAMGLRGSEGPGGAGRLGVGEVQPGGWGGLGGCRR